MLKRFLRRKDSCPDEDQLICFLEDRCQQAERVQIENHLHSCPACREALALLKEWLPYRRELASLIPSAAVDPDLWIRLNQKLEKESGSCKAESSRRSIRRLPLPQWGTVAAGITL
jgi:anti-sigma factor RsiW